MRRPFENVFTSGQTRPRDGTPAPWAGLGSICVVGLACQDLAGFEGLVRQTKYWACREVAAADQMCTVSQI